MIYLAGFILIFALIQLIVAFTNFIYRQKLAGKSDFTGLVSVLIPARNEEKNIQNLLNDLIHQQYQNIEILVFNDQSTDKTAQIVQEFSKSDKRIKLLNSKGLPEGWLGKNFACYSLSIQSKGDYMLFLDADVRIHNDIIIRSIHHLQKHKLGLLSIFPKQMMYTLGEKFSVPVMNYILLSLLPLILVRKTKFQSLAAANGQFMLFDSNIYFENSPHWIMKMNKVEDIEIARYFKMNGIKVACLAGNENISCRMYDGFNDSLKGFSKNVINFFGNSFLLAIGFWLITTFGFLLVLVALPKYLLIYLSMVLLTRIFISLVSKQNMAENILYLIPQQIVMGLFIFKALKNKFKKQLEWKGRNISLL